MTRQRPHHRAWQIAIYACAFAALVAAAHFAKADEVVKPPAKIFELKPGTEALGHLFCHTEENMYDVAILLDAYEAKQLPQEDLDWAMQGFLIRGLCTYVPRGALFTAVERVPAADIVDQLWKVQVKEDGTTWFMIHAVAQQNP